MAYWLPLPGELEQDPAAAPDALGMSVLNDPVVGLIAAIWLASFSPDAGISKYHPAREVVVASVAGRPHVKLPTLIVFVEVLTVPAINRPRPLMAELPAGELSAVGEPLSYRA